MKWLKTPWTLVALIVIGGLAALEVPRATQATPPPKLVGTVLTGMPAPAFQLRDQFGKTVSLTQYRGHPVILTFMDSLCTQLCPLVAQSIHNTLLQMGTAARKVGVLAISVDPEGDTPRSVRAYSQRFGLYHTWHYLTASRATLAPIWRDYYLYVAPANAPASVRNAHTSATYLIDSRGRERVLRAGLLSQEDLKHDLLVLSGLPVTVAGPQNVAAPEVGHPAPAFTLAALHGPSLAPQSLRGKVVLVNFWATWCVPCKTETPLLEHWYRTLASRGFVVLGVDEQESASAVAGFVRAYHLTYPMALDSNGDAAVSYNLAGTPSSFLLDRSGTIVAIHVGAVDTAFMQKQVLPLVRA